MFTRFFGCDIFLWNSWRKNNIWIAESLQFGDGKSTDKIVLFEYMNLTRMLLKLMNNHFCSRTQAAHTHSNCYGIRERDRDYIEIHANSFNQIKTIAYKCMYHTQKVVKFMPSLNLVSAPEMIMLRNFHFTKKGHALLNCEIKCKKVDFNELK